MACLPDVIFAVPVYSCNETLARRASRGVTELACGGDEAYQTQQRRFS